jgi:hypothetical protein
MLIPGVASAEAEADELVSGLQGASGSTIGPDGAIYVTEGLVGRISRIDPSTGEVTTFAEGLPPSIVGIGGAIDVAFARGTAYVLVTLVGPDVGGGDVVGIYRVDGYDEFTVLADIGQWSIDNPPDTAYFIPSGVQYALEARGDGLIVTDGHHNRVLHVSYGGAITEVMTFDNIVPTGMDFKGNRMFMAEAGPVPHSAEDGRVVVFRLGATRTKLIASGAPLLVDVEFGPSGRLFGLSQGDFPAGAPDGSPALPDTGALMVVRGGQFVPLVSGINQPTSLEFIGNTAYVVTLTGEVLAIDL